ncbi:carbohydrate-binding domain-containing protein [Eubacteriales bacterium OttesenSCG-928-N13]|nr:carbohydrate-binding domain-containing protein [Eubacteriales bacterium OttesenSCG-928-N13]
MKHRIWVGLLLALVLALGGFALAEGAQPKAAKQTVIDLGELEDDRTIAGSGSYLVTGTSTQHRLLISGGSPQITLQNVSMRAGGGVAPIEITGEDTKVTLKLSGQNVLVSSAVGEPALAVEGGASVTIQNLSSKKPGKLYAYHRPTGESGPSSGVIGGETKGTIQIKSGEIRALVQESGPIYSGHAGIGGGTRANGYQIRISGGTVNAKGGNGGAGIGSGYDANATVTISGGKVTAQGGTNGAGIGSGSQANATVTISGGKVTAMGGNSGAGIGSGFRANATVTISGGTVNATGGTHGAGIGSGSVGSSANVQILGGKVTATSGHMGRGGWLRRGRLLSRYHDQQQGQADHEWQDRCNQSDAEWRDTQNESRVCQWTPHTRGQKHAGLHRCIRHPGASGCGAGRRPYDAEQPEWRHQGGHGDRIRHRFFWQAAKGQRLWRSAVAV